MRATTYRKPDAEGFAFTAENLELAKRIVARYPEGRQQSAVIPLLDLGQRQNQNHCSPAVIEYVAGFLGMPPIRVYEVASFYSMFNKRPVGKYLVQVCRTTPCWLRGADSLTQAVKDFAHIEKGETSADGLFTLVEVECLGACCNAPMVQINDDYYEDLTAESLQALLTAFRHGKEPPKGSQTGRLGSSREGGPHTLTQLPASYPSGILRNDPPAPPPAPAPAAAAPAAPAAAPPAPPKS
jgi:NADH-quinone oxidoreductase E subunit